MNPCHPPWPRRTDLERALCEAIRARRSVRLRYGDDAAQRLFASYAVFHATTGKVNVAGVRVKNPADADTADRPE